MREFVIVDNESGQRFDKYLFKLLKNAGTGLIFKQLRCKNITLNKAKAKGNEILHSGDVVRIFMSDDTIDKFMGSNTRQDAKPVVLPHSVFTVVYEDENIIIADKPAGVLSQKSKPDDYSMNEMLLDYLRESGQDEIITHTFTPAFCNRLDRNTSGLMVGGKSLAGLQKMSEIIKDRTIHKYYLAIVVGNVPKQGKVSGYLYKDNAHNKVVVSDCQMPDSSFIDTEYEPLEHKDGLTLLKVKLITGKTHQIRAHMAYIGCPLLGDGKYGSNKVNKSYGIKTQALYSYKLRFTFKTDGGILAYLNEREFTVPKVWFEDMFLEK